MISSMLMISFVIYCVIAAITLMCTIIFHPIKTVKTLFMVVFGVVGIYFVANFLHLV